MKVAFAMFWIAVVVQGMLPLSAACQENSRDNELIHVGVAQVDVTPRGFIRLSGGMNRDTVEVDGVTNRLYAKAMVFGREDEQPAILITVDVEGIPADISSAVAERLGVDPSRVSILASRTSGGPEIGMSMNMLMYTGNHPSSSEGLTLSQLGRLAEYRRQLIQGLEEVAVKAWKDRRLARVSWGQGQVSFTQNIHGPGEAVDPTLPLLRVTDPDGKLRAVFINYASPATTIPYSIKRIHGDWPSAVQFTLGRLYPGVTAMIAIGCGADTRPTPNGRWDNVWAHAGAVVEQVQKLLQTPLKPLTQAPQVSMKWVKLPYADVPSVKELIQNSASNSLKGYYSHRTLERMVRGVQLSDSILYPVQVWTFGDELAMINLGGEVVPDYAIRLQNEIGAEKIWVNGYANDVSGYIGSRKSMSRAINKEEWEIYGYDRPSLLTPDIEEIIIETTRELLPPSFKVPRPMTNVPAAVQRTGSGTYLLTAESASAHGPNIKYMPEWRAFGWFSGADRLTWEVAVEKKGKYDVYMEWSVKDQEAGKPFVLTAGNRLLKGKVGNTGSWFTYRTEKIGAILLSPGRQQIEFKAAVPAARSLMDFRSLRLVLQE